MTAYYNEIDPKAAQWLCNLIAAGHIAPGDVDTRSVWDVHPDDLIPYRQCHFFAGVGVWSHALRLAGWPDDRPVWTGSCPCQPFSAAGKGRGIADERHLWPAWWWLIRERRPGVVFGEQVESPAGRAWLDAVQADMERGGYAVGPAAFPAAGVGAPHGRHRLYWVAHADGIAGRQGGPLDARRDPRGDALQGTGPGRRSRSLRMEHPDVQRREGVGLQLLERGSQPPVLEAARGSEVDGERPGPVNGFWRTADWLACTDEKWRPVEQGTFPLVDGAPGRLVGLRAYGNAIVSEAAAEFIRAYTEVRTP